MKSNPFDANLAYLVTRGHSIPSGSPQKA